MRSLVVTADDFGMALEVNEAVEIAHTRGILTAASLMVSAPATLDAVERARRLPSLKVGLHLVLVDGRPTLPVDQVPDLVDATGAFHDGMTRAGIAMFVRPKVRRQVAAEIEAQFAAFAATGLTLDHVNAHKHFHLHPTIARCIVETGLRYGVHTVRVPNEPSAHVRRIDPTTPSSPSLWPHTALLRRRLNRSGIASADRVYGLAWSGAMTTPRLVSILQDLPPGNTEIYLHPATADRFAGSCPGYAYASELDALTSPTTLAAMAASRTRLESTLTTA